MFPIVPVCSFVCLFVCLFYSKRCVLVFNCYRLQDYKKGIYSTSPPQKTEPLKCPCNEKFVGATKQHLQTSLNNGVFSFSVSCFVLGIVRFFKTCKLSVFDVIYSRLINSIYKMVNISVNSRQNFFKLCMTIASCSCTPLFLLFFVAA